MIDGTEDLVECPVCGGRGDFDIGDVEDGVCEICPECEGSGLVEDYENKDVFDPKRDAFKVGD